jgi:hypothetical protein
MLFGQDMGSQADLGKARGRRQKKQPFRCGTMGILQKNPVA